MNRLRLIGLLFAAALAAAGCQTHDKVVADGAWVEKVAGGFAFTEGPAWDGEGGLFFTDIPNNRIYRYDPATDGVTVWREESGGANGLMFDSEGRLYAAEGGNRRLARLTKTASGDVNETVLAAYHGVARYNSPNDLVLDEHGGIYLTDPRYGNRDSMEMAAEAVYYISNEGEVTSVISNLVRPNGVVLSPNHRTLYVADNGAKTIMAYDVVGAGKLANGRVFAWMDPNSNGGGDGMTVDALGNVYCAGQGGVWIWNDQGALIEQITVPESPSNVAFGGPAGSDLYITARTGLYRVRTNVSGVYWLMGK